MEFDTFRRTRVTKHKATPDCPSDQNVPKSNNKVVHGCNGTKTFPGIEIAFSFTSVHS